MSVFRERLDAIECDPRICAVVIRINTPGGSVTATDIMWRDLMAFKRRTCLPVIACLMDVAAGGGYYLATAADSIVAHPTTVTGGIGCILNVYNLQDLMAQFNILGAPIKAGPNIDLGSPIKELSDEKRKLLQDMADEFHSRFRNVVLQSRPNVDAKARDNIRWSCVYGHAGQGAALDRSDWLPRQCGGRSPIDGRRQLRERGFLSPSRRSDLVAVLDHAQHAAAKRAISN